MNRQESLAFLRAYFNELFGKRNITALDLYVALARDGVISAYLEWYILEDRIKRVIRKGVAIFVVQDRKIRKRHTFVYDESASQ